MRCASAPDAGREQQHEDRDREQRRARLERGVAEVGLQVHDEQEERRRRARRRRAKRDALAPENWRERKTSSGTIGCAGRCSIHDERDECQRRRRRREHDRPADQPLAGPSMSAYTTPPRPSREHAPRR